MTVPEFDLAHKDFGVGVTTLEQVTLYATDDNERRAIMLLHFSSVTDAQFALAEWQRQLAPYTPSDLTDAF
jgi:hypothetical protein